MIYTIKISLQAANDLDDIYRYIAFHLQSPENAARQLARLKKMIQSLDTMPFRFRKYNSSTFNKTDIRIAVVNRYCIFYEPNEDTKEVVIVRVIYGTRNLPPLLEND